MDNVMKELSDAFSNGTMFPFGFFKQKKEKKENEGQDTE